MKVKIWVKHQSVCHTQHDCKFHEGKDHLPISFFPLHCHYLACHLAHTVAQQIFVERMQLTDDGTMKELMCSEGDSLALITTTG